MGLYVDALFLDGDGALAETEITGLYDPALSSNGIVYASDAVIRFDPIATRELLSTGDFFAVALHELAHAAGFGLLWSDNGLYLPGSGAYTGAAGLAAYRAEFDPEATFVPVEISTGMAGSDDLHWAEDWAGGMSEFLTSFLDVPETFSNTSLLSLRDLGYTTRDSIALVPAPIPLPPAGMALGAGLFALALLRRRPAADAVAA